MAEKTEKATPKKLKDARKKGQVAKAQDLPAAFTFITSLSVTLVLMSYLFSRISAFTVSVLKEVGSNDNDFESKIPMYFHSAMEVILHCSLPIMIAVGFVGVIVSFLTVGPVFSLQAMKFDLKKLDPIQGIKQKFKVKVLVELIKSILKITGAGLIIYFLISKMLQQIISSVLLPILGSAAIVHDFIISATIQVGLFFLLVALFDLSFQKKNFAKEMMMEKFEIKQEYKDTEGDPHIKGRRKEIQREIAYQEGPGAAKGARVIVTNPTHIAVALKYNPEEEPAPMILTMGAGATAENIIKVGVENNIPVMRNVELARALYTKGKISDYVPEDLYSAIAEVLKWIEAIEKSDVDTDLFK